MRYIDNKLIAWTQALVNLTGRNPSWLLRQTALLFTICILYRLIQPETYSTWFLALGGVFSLFVSAGMIAASYSEFLRASYATLPSWFRLMLVGLTLLGLVIFVVGRIHSLPISSYMLVGDLTDLLITLSFYLCTAKPPPPPKPRTQMKEVFDA
jgi:hypothetical protein